MRKVSDMQRRFIISCLAFLATLVFHSSSTAQEPESVHPLGEWRAVTSPYGHRTDPTAGRGAKRKFHRGIDLAVQIGDPVYAWRTGMVAFTGWNHLSGKIITLEHLNGYLSKYHHLDKILVKEGEIVVAGQLIGRAGATGNATGPHLHFTIKKKGRYRNPYSYLKTAVKKPSPQDSLNLAALPTIKKTITLRSHPVGGKVYIDGEFRGNTPLEIQLPYGKYFLEVDGGESYRLFSQRLVIDEHSNLLFSAELRADAGDNGRDMALNDYNDRDYDERNPAAGSYHDRDLDFGESEYLRGLVGIGALANLTRPRGSRLAAQSNLQFGIDIGFSAFLESERLLLRSHLLQLHFTFLKGAFEEKQFFYRRESNGGNEVIFRERFDNYLVSSAALAYFVAPEISSRLNLLAGGEFGFGLMEIRTLRQQDTDGGAPDGFSGSESDVNPISYKLRFMTPALSGGLMIHPLEQLTIIGRYSFSMFAKHSNWSGFKLGLIRRF